MNMMRKGLLIAGIVLAGEGCSYGVRGGVAGFANTAGPIAVDADVAGGIGLGDDGSSYNGFHMTGEVAVGYDAAGQALHVATLIGIEGFRQPTDSSSPLGFRAGAAGGIDAGRDDGTMSALVLATGGGRYRLGDSGHTVTFFDFGGALGGGIGIDGANGKEGESGFVGMLTLGFGVLHVDHWDMRFR
ncbi:MAG: hypothetical protein U0414_03460 [Polyangiaceae bacterium]